MTLSEIQTMRDLAYIRLQDATAQSMSHKGRSVANYELDVISKEFEKWELQLQRAKAQQAGRPSHSLASFN